MKLNSIKSFFLNQPPRTLGAVAPAIRVSGATTRVFSVESCLLLLFLLLSFPFVANAADFQFLCDITGTTFSNCPDSVQMFNGDDFFYGIYEGTLISNTFYAGLGTGVTGSTPWYGPSGFLNSHDIGSDMSSATTGDYFILFCPLSFDCIDGSSDRYYFPFHYDSGVISEVEVITDTSTRIISVSPISGSTVSTTTTTGAHVYINPSDFEDGMYLQFSFTNQTVENVGGTALDAWNAAFDVGLDVRIPITASSTDLDLSTTTTFASGGVTQGTYKIVKPTFTSSLWFFGQFFNGQTVLSTTTSFVIGQKSGLDIAIEQGGASVASYLITGTTTTPVLMCNPDTSFSLEACLTSVLLPSKEVLRDDYMRIYTGFLTSFPIGYVTRFINILALTETSEPPPITYTFGSSSPTSLQGTTVTIQPFDHFDVLTTIKTDNGNNKDIWDIVMPYFKVVINFAVLFVILEDLIGFQLMVDKTQASREAQKRRNDRMFQSTITNKMTTDTTKLPK